jgi:hypothetical protein
MRPEQGMGGQAGSPEDKNPLQMKLFEPETDDRP